MNGGSTNDGSMNDKSLDDGSMNDKPMKLTDLIPRDCSPLGLTVEIDAPFEHVSLGARGTPIYREAPYKLIISYFSKQDGECGRRMKKFHTGEEATEIIRQFEEFVMKR